MGAPLHMLVAVEAASQLDVRQARDAMARHSWAEALKRFAAADAQGALPAADLRTYAEAATWCARSDLAGGDRRARALRVARRSARNGHRVRLATPNRAGARGPAGRRATLCSRPWLPHLQRPKHSHSHSSRVAKKHQAEALLSR